MNIYLLNQVYDDLITYQNQLNNKVKSKTDEKTLKKLEYELTMCNNLLRPLLKTINYYKVNKKN